jgi:methylated-DNA-[protein]-cysteine S-methyltransferase
MCGTIGKMKIYYQKIGARFADLYAYAGANKLLGLFFEQSRGVSYVRRFGENEIIDEPNEILLSLGRQLKEYSQGRSQVFAIPMHLEGSDFQLSAWRAIAKIPYGATMSYASQARVMGKPKAFRAVGLANNQNCFPILIPCHRVLRSDGSLGGYSGGVALKFQLLEFEKATVLGL